MNKQETKEAKKITLRDYRDGVRIIWNEIITRHKKEIYILILISFFIAIGDGLIPLVSGRFYDSISTITTTTKYTSIIESVILIISGPVGITFGLLMTFTALSAFGGRMKGMRSEKLQGLLYLEYIADSSKKIMNLPMSFHNNNPMSEIDQKITRAASNLSTMTHDVILELLPAFLGIIVALIASFSLNSTLAWIIVVGVIIYAIFIIRTVGDGATLQRNNQKAWIKAWRERSDGLYNISTVKQFAAENYESQKNVTNFIGGVNGAQLKLYALWNSISLSQKVIILLTQSVVLILSLVFIQRGLMSIGQVIAFNAYVGMMFGPFLRIGQMWRTIQNSIVTISDANKIITTPGEEYHASNSIKKEILGNVEFKNVTFYHDERKKILKNISLNVPAGKKIALVGETGSGKTSLIELIFKFYLPQQGDILIDDISIKDYGLTNLRSQIGVVPQEPVLFDTTILNNITYPKTKVPFEIVREAAKKAELLDFIEDQPDKWKTIVGDRGVKLSGGQKQRIAIARAIIENPKILILDESTSALDAKTQRSIEASLEELMEGRTTFIVAHRLSAVRNADTICVLHKGKILEQGTHEELMAIEKGKYKQLYELQFQEKEIIDQEENVLD